VERPISTCGFASFIAYTALLAFNRESGQI
jgi:hypothetical protein